MLSQNPGVLSLFEWFSGIDQFFRFRPGPVEGSELAGRLRQDHPMLTMVLKRGYEVPEVAYPFGRAGMRFALGDPVPWCLGIALARISDQPDLLFDEMLAYVEDRPTQPLASHYREIFDWLIEKLGRRWWIERSGGSIEFLAELHELFPEARIVHIHRDGRETALSMREYPVLRLAVSVMYGLVGEIEYSYDGLTELEKSDRGAIDRLLETRPPIELYGRYWSEQIERGTEALRSLPADSLLDLRFEDLVADPHRELERLADFLEIGRDDDWITRAGMLVRGMPPLRFPDLSEEERERLEETCAPGMKLLERAM
jgi:putative sulfotransferase